MSPEVNKFISFSLKFYFVPIKIIQAILSTKIEFYGKRGERRNSGPTNDVKTRKYILLGRS